jgi:hypothetical protein
MIRLPRWTKGRPILAEDLNKLAEGLERGLAMRAGRGLSIKWGAGGIQIGLDNRLREFWSLCRIEQVVTPAGVVLTPAQYALARLPLDTMYRVRDALSSKVYPAVPGVQGLLPVYGRAVFNNEVGVYAARPGDFCAVWLNVRAGQGTRPVPELEVWTEKPARTPC